MFCASTPTYTHTPHTTHLHIPIFKQLEFLLHLLDVTGPILDKMVRILNAMRRMLPVDKTNYMVSKGPQTWLAGWMTS